MKLSAPINELKRKAKLIRRKEDIPLNRALERIAKEEGHASWGLLIHDYEAQKPKPNALPRTGYQITSLPVDASYRREAISLANSTFEMVVRRIEPDNPRDTRALWDAEDYVDNHHLSPDMLPIDSEYALSLIEAFLVHHVIDLAVRADDAAGAETYTKGVGLRPRLSVCEVTFRECNWPLRRKDRASDGTSILVGT